MENGVESLYDKASEGAAFSPFSLRFDEIERLLLINFEKDPDEIYLGLEPQLIDDPYSGRGLRVIAWRKDGFVDVYQQPGLSIPASRFEVAGKGLADLLQRRMENARFDITEKGVDVYFSFVDKEGRLIEVSIKEKHKRPVKTFDILAPVGNSSKAPCALPLFYLFGFYFVRKRNTKVQIKIDETLHRADGFPIPVDGSRIYFMRYSKDPFLLNWNQAQEGPLSRIEVRDGKGWDDQGITYGLEVCEGHYEIRKIKAGNGKHDVSIAFSPTVPDLVCLRDQSLIKGEFSITSNASVGSIDGVYQISREKSKIKMSIHPTGGWSPNEPRKMINMIYRMAPLFKNWPKSYIWTAHIDVGDGHMPTMKSQWKRNE